MSLSSNQKYITIATDISCDPKHRITTWACYIRYGGGAIKQTGRFKTFYHSVPAETYALVNALHIAYTEIPDWSESRVIIHNEIENVLTPLLTKHGNPRESDKDRTAAIVLLALPILDRAQSWERRKIKAHFAGWEASDNPKKYAINRWCDVESRALMKRIRKELLAKKA